MARPVARIDARVVVDGSEAMGFVGSDFRDRLTVVDAGPTGFTVNFGPDGADGAVRLRGVGPSHRTVERFGHEIPTPHRGVLTGFEATDGDWALFDFDFTLDAARFFEVTRTPSNADDLALFRSLFAGDDVIIMKGRGNDRLTGFG